MTAHQVSAIIPVSCGLFLLWCVFAKDPWVQVLRPTLVMLSLSGLTWGLLVVLLDDHAFRALVGRRVAVWLGHFKFFVGGLGTGAAVSSAFYGHWKSAWLAKRTSG